MTAFQKNKNRSLQSSQDEESSSSLDNVFSLTENENNYVTEYSCPQLVQHNPTNLIEISFLYDLINPETEDSDLARQQFESLLLQRIAAHFGLQNGESCLSPPTKDDDTFTFAHMIQATSLPDDLPNPKMSECLTPININQACISYIGALSMKILGPDDKNDIIDFIADSIDNGIVTSGTSLEAAFLGTKIEEERDFVLPAINTIESPQGNTAEENALKKFTSVGVLLVVALSAGVVGSALMVLRMHRRRKKWSRENIIVSHHHDCLHKGQQGIPDTQDTSSGSEEKESEPAELPQNFGLDCYAASENNFTDLDDIAVRVDNKTSYEFDLGNSMRSSMFGVHGHRPNPFFPELESSSLADSDVDSWAQTDATIGSLDERINVLGGDDDVGEI